MTSGNNLASLLQQIIEHTDYHNDRNEWRPEVAKRAHQALEQAKDHDLLRARNEYLEAQFQFHGEERERWFLQIKETTEERDNLTARCALIISAAMKEGAGPMMRAAIDEPLPSKSAPAAVPVATIQAPDPEEERVGFWLSLSDKLRLAALPVGTKLYTAPPTPPEGWKLVPVKPQQGQQETAAFNLCNDYGPDYVMEHRAFALDAYRALVLTAPRNMEPTQ